MPGLGDLLEAREGPLLIGSPDAEDVCGRRPRSGSFGDSSCSLRSRGRAYIPVRAILQIDRRPGRWPYNSTPAE